MKFKKVLLSLVLTLALFSNANAAPILTFLIDGDTFQNDFSISNDSTDGEKITGFQLDLRTADNRICFDLDGNGDDSISDSCNAGNPGLSFVERSGGSDTGLISSSVIDAVGSLDAFDFLEVLFSDFGPGEEFSWAIDIDTFNGGRNGGINGRQMIGSTVTVDFSSGIRASGRLTAVDGNFDASAFIVESITDITEASAPATIVLFGLGLVGLSFARRRASV